MNARDEGSIGIGQDDLPPKDVSPTHQAFSWLHIDPTNRSAAFIERVADVCSGLQTCLELIHATDLALYARSMDDDEAMPVLGTVDRERLLRLAVAATAMLSDHAHEEIQWMNDRSRQQVAGEVNAK